MMMIDGVLFSPYCKDCGKHVGDCGKHVGDNEEFTICGLCNWLYCTKCARHHNTIYARPISKRVLLAIPSRKSQQTCSHSDYPAPRNRNLIV